MHHLTVLPLIRDGVLDASLTSLIWLLVDDAVPLLVTGTAPAEARREVAGALLSIDPTTAWLVLDAEVEPPTLARLSALLQGGSRLGITVTAPDLPAALERLLAPPGRLPYDAIRRLGIVVTLEQTSRGLRCRLVHLLRPTERDAQGHVQRRPPAILASWDEAADRYDDYAWALTPELAERLGRRQAELEEHHRARADLLAATARLAHIDRVGWEQRVREQLATERG
jgi:hypothetical protein